MTETSAAAEETTLLEGKLTYSEKEFTLEIDTAAGGRLSFSLMQEGYDEYRAAFACAVGEFALDADIHTGYDVFEMEANLKFDGAKVRLTLNVDDDDMDGKLDIMGGEDYLTINLHGSDDVFTLNGFGRVSGDTFSVNALFVDTYRGLEGTFNIDVIEEDDITSIEGSVTYEEGRPLCLRLHDSGERRSGYPLHLRADARGSQERNDYGFHRSENGSDRRAHRDRHEGRRHDADQQHRRGRRGDGGHDDRI